MKFIISNYDDLPNVTVFCKDNIFTRHISIEIFLKLIKRKCFTNLDKSKTNNIFPINLNLSDNSYVEINNSWYKFDLPRKYFSEYNGFHSFVFKCDNLPEFIMFSPGANYIVPKENILIRSKKFILIRSKKFCENLIKFIDYSKLSCESHYLERSLLTIFNSNVESSYYMDHEITNRKLILLVECCQSRILKESKLQKKIKNFIIKKSFYLIYKVFKILK